MNSNAAPDDNWQIDFKLKWKFRRRASNIWTQSRSTTWNLMRRILGTYLLPFYIHYDAILHTLLHIHSLCMCTLPHVNLTRRTFGTVLHTRSCLIYITTHSLTFHLQYYAFTHFPYTILHIHSHFKYSATHPLTFHIQYYTFTHISFAVLHIHPSYSRREPRQIWHGTLWVWYYTFTHFPYTILHIRSCSTTQYCACAHFPNTVLRILISILTNSLTFHIQYYTFTHLLYTVLHVHSLFIL